MYSIVSLLIATLLVSALVSCEDNTPLISKLDTPSQQESAKTVTYVHISEDQMNAIGGFDKFQTLSDDEKTMFLSKLKKHEGVSLEEFISLYETSSPSPQGRAAALCWPNSEEKNRWGSCKSNQCRIFVEGRGRYEWFPAKYVNVAYKYTNVFCQVSYYVSSSFEHCHC